MLPLKGKHASLATYLHQDTDDLSQALDDEQHEEHHEDELEVPVLIAACGARVDETARGDGAKAT